MAQQASANPTRAASAGANPSLDGADPVIAAAGDISCAPTDSAFDGHVSTKCQMRATLAQIQAGTFTALLPLGDEQYECGGATAFSQSYHLIWGQENPIAWPAPGNHEYQSGTDCGGPGAVGYRQEFPTFPGVDGNLYYSFDVGTWHLISLNSNCSFVSCAKGSAQEQWLANDLATHLNVCTVAYWHHPRFGSGAGHVLQNKTVAPFWDDLYASHADIVLNGHRHYYEALSPLNPAEQPDVNGIREFIVGTGGRSHGGGNNTVTHPQQIAFDRVHFGLLELTLHPLSYDWAFVATDGTVIHSGSASCVV